MVTCTVEEEQKVEPVKPPETTNKKNPYSVENVTQAFENLVAQSGGRIKVAPPSTTHNYVQFQPQNLDQVMLLQDLGYDLWDEPLDQHIEFSGDSYHHPGLLDSLNYFYTLIPENYAIIQSVPHTILSQVILFDEDAGDEQDPEEDPWIPDPGCGTNLVCYCYDEWGQVYICNTDPRVYLRKKAGDGLPEDLVKKTTKYLLEGGVNLIELHDEAMKLAGYEEDMIEGSDDGRTKSIRYYPAGYIRVVDNSLAGNPPVPAKGVKVKARRFIKIKSSFTNNSGYFYINKGYKQRANIIVKFKNDYAKVRGISGALKLWEYVFPVRKKLGMYEKNSLQNINYTFGFNSNAQSSAALQFAAAHCLNTLSETRQYANNNSLIGYAPGSGYKLNIWISAVHTQGGSAPMLRAIANSSFISNAIDFALPALGAAIKRTVQNYLPDVTLRLQNQSGSTRSAESISGTFFHEFAHTMHYNKVGNNYWVNLISAVVTNGGYGSKNSLNSGYIAVAESWAYFLGPTYTRTKYLSNSIIAEKNLNFLERQKNNNNEPKLDFDPSLGYSQGWIPWGMLHDLIDTGEPSITLINDQVSGYTINGIFKGFHQGSTSVQNLKAAILANNGNSQATQVNTLVTGYGW